MVTAGAIQPNKIKTKRGIKMEKFNNRQKAIESLTDNGYKYKCHCGGMYSQYRANKYVNAETGDVKYINEDHTLNESNYWITNDYLGDQVK